MERNKGIKAVLGLLVLLVAISLATWAVTKVDKAYERMRAERENARRDTVVVIDTVFIDRPIVKDSTIVKYVFRTFKVVDTLTVMLTDTLRDSILVEVPIMQKTYAGDDYQAWVSGYEPRLDSIEIYRRETTIRVKPRKWSIGFQAGYGLTTKGFAPYIGVGVGYKLPP